MKKWWIAGSLLGTGFLCAGIYLVVGMCNDVLFSGDVLYVGDNNRQSVVQDPFVERYIKEVERVVSEYEEVKNRYIAQKNIAENVAGNFSGSDNKLKSNVNFSNNSLSTNNSLSNPSGKVNNTVSKSGTKEIKGSAGTESKAIESRTSGKSDEVRSNEARVNEMKSIKVNEERVEELSGGDKYFALFVASADDTYGQLFRKCGFEVRSELIKSNLSMVLDSKIGRRVVVKNCGSLIEDLQKRFPDIDVSFDEKTGTVVLYDFYAKTYFLNPRGIEDFKRRAPNYLVDDKAEIKVYPDGRVKVFDVRKGHERIENLIKEINEAVAFQNFKYRYEVLCDDGKNRRTYTGWILPDVPGKLGVEGELQVVKRNKDEVWIRVFLYKGVDKVVPFKRSGGEEEIKEYVGGDNLRILLKVREEG